MEITCFENSLFNSISYLIELENNLIIIDPSNDDLFLELIKKSKFKKSHIFLTHEHIDHILAIVKLKEIYSDIIIVATEHTSKAVIDPKKNLSIFHGLFFLGVKADINIIKNCEIEIGNTKINLYPCKGHSLGGMFININNVLFTGDEFIFELKTITKLPGGNMKELFKSYDFLNLNFDSKTILYPGHGKSFLLEELKLW
jgi:glyoxylase-like metal-dependent hydrolase (beta-lactamase superfamily II)